MTRTALLIAPLLCALLPAAALGMTQRFALITGANDGGPERVVLRYANRDAEAVAQVLEELGGVAPGGQTLLLEVDRAALLAALEQVGARLEAARAAGDRVELVFYYSGHSDEEGLLLGGERLGYRELRGVLDTIPADVRVAIVDSCASGELTRRKGGVRRPPFLLDTSAAVKGLAILTSSSATEASQESDRIGGSFFTHYLISGLRGAADHDTDGRVTLNEAYQFTFQETLARTEKTQSGPQHPAYDMQLAGTGDLVMTDLRSTSAGLVLAEGLEGRVFIRDGEGLLAAELRKHAGRPVELGLQPGAYHVTLERGERLAAAELTLVEERRTLLDVGDFTPLRGEANVTRGDVEQRVAPTRSWFPVEAALLPWVTTNSLFAEQTTNLLSLQLFGGRPHRLHGLGLGLFATYVDAQLIGAQVATLVNLSGGEVHGLQVATLGNYSHGPSGALQVTSAVNVAREDLSVGQIGVAANLALGALDGGQLGVGFNYVSGHLNGGQVAVGFNLATGDVYGAQIAAAGLNLATGQLRGLQLAMANIATDVTGVQLGLVNVAGEATGVQLGLVNFAGALKGVPIGLVSVAGNGIHDLQFWADDTALFNAGFKLGGEQVYGIWSAGLDPRGAPLNWMLGLGIGGRVPLPGDFFLDLDVTGNSVQRGSWFDQGLDLLNKGKITLGWRPFEGVAVVGGLNLNVLVSDADEAAELTLIPSAGRWVLADAPVVALWPGLHFGLQL